MEQHWQKNLEMIGAPLFLGYRKRLMSPGISWEIMRAYPGASLIDVMVRVHAGRQLIRDGEDFLALAQIRSGHWLETGATGDGLAESGDCGSGAGRWHVQVGAALFGVFAGLSLAHMAGGGTLEQLVLGGLLGAALAMLPVVQGSMRATGQDDQHLVH